MIDIKEAIVIEKGKTYVIELDEPMTRAHMESIMDTWRKVTKSNCVILDSRAKIARNLDEVHLREEIAKQIEMFGILPSDDTTEDEIKMFKVMREAAAKIARGEL